MTQPAPRRKTTVLHSHLLDDISVIESKAIAAAQVRELAGALAAAQAEVASAASREAGRAAAAYAAGRALEDAQAQRRALVRPAHVVQRPLPSHNSALRVAAHHLCEASRAVQYPTPA